MMTDHDQTRIDAIQGRRDSAREFSRRLADGGPVVSGSSSHDPSANDDIDYLLAALARLQAENTELAKALTTWRSWAQFIFQGGGPVSGSDAELRAAVCAAYDAEVARLHAERDQRKNDVSTRIGELGEGPTPQHAAENQKD